MEANESSGLTYSTYNPSHHQAQAQAQQSEPQGPRPTSFEPNNNGPGGADGMGGAMYPQSIAGKAPTIEQQQQQQQRRKRGRPRKYGTPEAAAAAKRAALPAKRKQQPQQQQQQQQQQHQEFIGSSNSSSASSIKSNFAPNGGHGFTPHVINVAAGEDVAQKIIFFTQQAKRELCILSASGSIASAALQQSASSGGNIAYQGRFDIISLTGSYVRSDQGGMAGGLSACLSSENGQILGGGICGPLIAAGPVEVIVATFLIDLKRDVSGGFKGDISASPRPSPVSPSPAIYRPVVESSGGFRVMGSDDDHRNMDGSAFMMQSQWRSGLNYDLTGNTGHNSHDSPENGDYEQMPD